MEAPSSATASSPSPSTPTVASEASSAPSSSASSSASASASASSSSASSASSSAPAMASSDSALRSTPMNVTLAREASSLFQSSRFNDCLDVLHQLRLSDPENPKVPHNIAVAEYFRFGCTDPQNLLNTFSKVKRRLEELSKNIGEQLDGMNALSINSPPNTTSLASKPAPGSSSEAFSAVCLEDYDTSIPTFNTAVVLFHLHQFSAALSVLEPLYQNIEPIDEPAALHICVLMLDIAIASCQLRKACDVLFYMERVFGLGFLVTPDSGSNVTSHSSLLGTLDSGANTENRSTNVDSPANSMIPETSLTRASSEEILDEDVLTLNLDMEGANSTKLGVPLSILSNTGRASSDRSSLAPARDSNMKIMLHLNKVRLFLCTRNVRSAKKEIKLAINLAQGNDLLKALMLKAQLEYSRGNHRKAVKLLMTCSVKEPGLRYLILNNLGCIHHYLGKDNTSYAYFLKALQSCTSISVEKPLRLSTFAQKKPFSILYNCGLQQLKMGNPVLASRCFQEAGILYHRQPLFWLRLAECCIMALEKGLLEGGGEHPVKKDELRVSSVCSGKWRTLILPSGSLNPSLAPNKMGLKQESETSTENSSIANSQQVNGTDSFAPGKTHKLSLVFGRQCLHNAKHLLSHQMSKILKAGSDADGSRKSEEGDMSEDLKNLSISSSNSKSNTTTGFQSNSNGNKEGKTNSMSAIVASVIAFEEDQQKRNSVLLQHILADLAFTELCLDNPVQALKSANQLLQFADCTKPFKFLARVYAAEALCILNRPKEASEELSMCMTENSNNQETPSAGGGEDEGQQWKSGENSEASGEGDDGISTSNTAPALSDSLTVSSLTGTRALSSLFINFSMVHAMLGNLSQAHQFAMQSLSITPSNPLAVLSMVYVNLLQGRTREAVILLKHCRHLCIVRSGSGSSSGLD